MENRSKFDTCEFDILFKDNFSFLCLISFSIVKDKETSKDIVQNFFLSYWQRRNSISINISFQAYAVKAVKNLSLLAIKKKKKEKFLLQKMAVNDYEVQKSLDELTGKKKILDTLNKLPLKRREIFIAAILNGHSYSEIAESRDISINTVKTQIKRSYSFLRTFMKEDFVVLLVFAFFK